MKILFLSLMLVGCGTIAVASPATEAEKQYASDNYAACAVEKIPSLDDGKSDATTIASAASTECNAEFNSMVAVYSKGQTTGAAQSIAKEMNAVKVKALVPLVLKLRQSQ